MNKTAFKWSILIIILISIVATIYFVFERIENEKSARATDLKKLIPENCDAFFVFKDAKQIEFLENNSVINRYLENKEGNSILKILSDMKKRWPELFQSKDDKGEREMIISYHSWNESDAELILLKMMGDDQETIEQLINNYFKSSFEPSVENNAGIKVYHYTLSNNNRFHCFYYKGVFAGSFDNRLIDQTILHIKNRQFSNYDPDFIDIENISDPKLAFQFYIKLNAIPLINTKNPTRVDTLNLCGWVSPYLELGDGQLTLSCSTAPQFEKSNYLSTLIGQSAARPFNPEVISDKSEFCIHLGIGDRTRFSENVHKMRSYVGADSTEFDRIKPVVDSIFDQHFDGEINLSYFPVYTPEKELRKVVVIRLKEEAIFIEKLKQLWVSNLQSKIESIPATLEQLHFPNEMIASLFGELFSIRDQFFHCNLFENYLIIASHPEIVSAYINELKLDHNLNNSLWYSEISSEINSKSNFFMIGNSGALIESQLLYPFGLPKVLFSNSKLFKNCNFCFQFNTEKSLIDGKLTIKLSDI